MYVLYLDFLSKLEHLFEININIFMNIEFINMLDLVVTKTFELVVVFLATFPD